MLNLIGDDNIVSVDPAVSIRGFAKGDGNKVTINGTRGASTLEIGIHGHLNTIEI